MSTTPRENLTRGITQAAKMLADASAPLVVAGALDLASAAAAASLAQRCGATLDHACESGLAPQQEQGTLGTAPGEAAVRADLVVVCGPVTERLSKDTAFSRLRTAGAKSRLVAFGIEAGDSLGHSGCEAVTLGQAGLAEQVGVLIALAQGKPVALDAACRDAANEFVQRLKQAKYGAFVFAPDVIGDMAQFALMSLSNTLSAETRWSVLPLGRPAGQGELIRMTQAVCGLPPPLSFAAARPRHDRLLFRAPVAIARRDADALVWLSAADEPPPEWLDGPPLIAISASSDALLKATVQIEVAAAVRDYEALVEEPSTGAITAQGATAPSNSLPRASDVIAAVEAEMVRTGTGAAA